MLPLHAFNSVLLILATVCPASAIFLLFFPSTFLFSLLLFIPKGSENRVLIFASHAFTTDLHCDVLLLSLYLHLPLPYSFLLPSTVIIYLYAFNCNLRFDIFCNCFFTASVTVYCYTVICVSFTLLYLFIFALHGSNFTHCFDFFPYFFCHMLFFFYSDTFSYCFCTATSSFKLLFPCL